MKLARSTYYYRSRRTAAAEKVVRNRVEALCANFTRDGYRRITHQLYAEGMIVNHKAVVRLMRESGLQVRPLRNVLLPAYEWLHILRGYDLDRATELLPNPQTLRYRCYAMGLSESQINAAIIQVNWITMQISKLVKYVPVLS